MLDKEPEKSLSVDSDYNNLFFVMFKKKAEVEEKKIGFVSHQSKHVLVIIVPTDCFKNAYWVATGTTLWFLVNC